MCVRVGEGVSHRVGISPITRSLVAVKPRRPPMHMTDVGTEAAFRQDQRKRCRKSKHP